VDKRNEKQAKPYLVVQEKEFGGMVPPIFFVVPALL
jgi:hypothetical protein